MTEPSTTLREVNSWISFSPLVSPTPTARSFLLSRSTTRTPLLSSVRQRLTIARSGGMRYVDSAPSNNNNALTSGLDPSGARPATGNFPILPVASNGALSIDAEGIALMNDGTFWISEEYGPSVYHIAANGTILSALAIPDSITPRSATGEVSVFLAN